MKKTLVVMAAGLGSRFGGLKQIEPVGPSGEFIIDYSVYDAKRAGFNKVVFVIKKELEEQFKNTIGKRLENVIEVAYAYQEIEDIPTSKKYLIEQRKKPWGTVQAILCTKDVVDEDFTVINADDFYGYDSFIKASKFLDTNKDPREYASITYPIDVVSSKYGKVKRGICYTENDNIVKIIESSVSINNDHAEAESLVTHEKFNIPLNQPTSMNMFVFKKGIYKYLEEYFENYFNQSDDVVLDGEALIPELILEKLKSNEIVLKNITSNGLWFGITYKEDLAGLKSSINELITKGEYPRKLW